MNKSRIELTPIDDKYEITLILKFPRYSVWFTTNNRMTKHEADIRIIQMTAKYGFDTDGIIVKKKFIDG